MTDDSKLVTEEGAEDEEVGARLSADREQVLSLATALYRDEMRRTVAWRGRLDRTTNWSVVLTATLLTWSFSSADHPHYVMLVALGGIVGFLFIEARRYRMYDVWRARLRLLEENVFADVFHPEGTEDPRWRVALSHDLRSPAFKMPWIEAVQRRLRRIYLPLMTVLTAAWVLRVTAFSREAEGLHEATAIGDIPGEVTVATVAGLYLAAVVAALWPRRRRARGSVSDRSEADPSWRS